MSLRARAFVPLARVSARLPAVRGRTRLFLELYKLLRLQNERVVVQTRLRDPLPFEAELDLRAWLQRVAFLTGGYEADTVRFLLELDVLDGRNGYLLDVGANIGLIAIPFALSTHRPVIAVEAVPDNVRALETNISLNDLRGDVTIVPIALGDEQKSVAIQVEGDLRAGEGTGTANILPDGSQYECVRQEIQVETLDSLPRTVIPEHCSLMKIDTDGYDLKVLQGATTFLARERPIIFGEFSQHCLGWHGQSVAGVIAFAQQHHYEVWQRIHPQWSFSAAVDETNFESDLLLVPKERRNAFESRLRHNRL